MLENILVELSALQNNMWEKRNNKITILNGKRNTGPS